MTLERTIHPVGQGAFYTEVFDNGDAVVYDCGTSKGSTASEIAKFKNQAKQIMALFISHFHQDHISGINGLIKTVGKPKYIFVPWLELDQRLNVFGQLLNQGLTQRNYLWAYDLVVTQKLEGTTIINVREDDEQQQDYFDFEESELETRSSIKHGTKLRHGNLWEYIPIVYINPKFQQTVVNNYRNQMLADFKVTDVEDLITRIPANWVLAKTIFKKYCAISDMNITSLMVYSGSLHTPQIRNIKTPTLTFGYKASQINSYIRRTKACAIYLGDVEVDNKILNAIETSTSKKRTNKIGVVQLAHHGSQYNYNHNMINTFRYAKMYFCCVGSHNKHHHPDLFPIVDLLNHNKYIMVIDEKHESLIQEIYN